MKTLCNDKDCFNLVNEEDIVMRPDGTPHPISLLCEKCTSDEDRKKLKNYRKKLRHKANLKSRHA